MTVEIFTNIADVSLSFGEMGVILNDRGLAKQRVSDLEASHVPHANLEFFGVNIICWCPLPGSPCKL